MKYLIYLISSFIMLSCTVDDEFVIPEGGTEGAYDYYSTTKYYDENGEQTEVGGNEGVINQTSTNLTITPFVGWIYDLDINNVQTHILSNGQVVTSFSITVQDEEIDAGGELYTFRVKGTRSIELKDSNGDTIGFYDGVIGLNDIITCEFESYNFITYDKVITSIEATPQY